MKKVKLFIIAFISLFLFEISMNAINAIDVSTFDDLKNQGEIGGDIKLSSNIDLTANVTLDNTILDLNGYTINTSGNTVIATGITIIKDTSSEGTGAIVNNTNIVKQIIESYDNFTFDSGIVDGKNGWPISAVEGTTTINGGTITSNSYTILNMSKVIINGGTISSTNGYTIYSYPSVENEINGGVIKTDGSSQVIQLNSGSSLVMSDGEVISPNGYGIVAFENTDVEISGGKIEAKWYGISGNGSPVGTSNSGENAKFRITGGTIIGKDSPAVYCPQIGGETTVTGGTFTGSESAIEIRAGKLDIAGGTFTGNLETYKVQQNDNGPTTTGSSVAIVQSTTKQPIAVNISGGRFRAYLPISEANIQHNEEEYISNIQLSITGGIFESTGNEVVSSEDLTGFITGGSFSKDMDLMYLSDNYSTLLKSGKYVVGLNRVVESDNNGVTFESEEAISNGYKLVVTDYSTEDVNEIQNLINVNYKDSSEVEDVKLLVVYDISIVEGNNVIPMEDGKFTIKMALDEKLSKYDKYKVIYIDEDGNIEETMDAELIDGNIVFATSHLSTYGVVGYNNTVENKSTLLENRVIVENPNTGDGLISYLVVGLISIFAALVPINKLKKIYNS